MPDATKTFSLSTPSATSLIDITSRIQEIMRETRVESGTCMVFVPHTTAGITINENADPDVQNDIARMLDKIATAAAGFYRHAEGNSPAHVKASLVGSSEMLIIKNGTLLLGTWQGVYFCEFDGPRKRNIIVKISKD